MIGSFADHLPTLEISMQQIPKLLNNNKHVCYHTK